MSTTDNKYTDKRHQIAKDPKKNKGINLYFLGF